MQSAHRFIPSSRTFVSTDMQVRSDVTSSRRIPAVVSIQGCPYTHSLLYAGSNPDVTCSAAAGARPLKNEYGLGLISNPFLCQIPLSTESTHIYNLSFIVLCAGHI